MAYDPWELMNWLAKCAQFQPHHLHNPTCDATLTKKSLGDVSAKWLKQLCTIIKNGIYMWFWSLYTVARKDKNKDASFTSKHTMQQSLTIWFSC